MRGLALFALAVGVLFAVLGGIVFVLGLADGSPVAMTVGGVILLVTGGLLWWSIRTLRRTAPSKTAGGRIGAYQVGAPEERTVGGERYEVFFRKAGHKNNPPAALFVQVPAASPAEVTFAPEGWFDRLGKRLGIAQEVQTGDAEFDDSVYVRAASDGFAEQYLTEPARRAAVLALRRIGFTAVRLTKTHAQAEWLNFNPSGNDRPDLADTAAAAVLVLAAGVPKDEPDDDRPAGNRKGRAAALWVLAAAWAVLLGFAFWFKPVRTAELVVPGLGLGAAVWCGFAWLAGLVLRGTSTSHDLWGTLVAVGVVLAGMGGVGATAAVNGLTDDGPVVVHQQPVTDKRISRGKNNSKSYYVSVSDWARPGDAVEFQVSAGEYDATVPGRSRMEVTVRPGAVGIEWLEKKWLVP